MSFKEIQKRQSSQFKFDVVCIDCECSRRLAIDEYKRYVCDICNSDNIAIEGCELVDAVEVAHQDRGELLTMVEQLQEQVDAVKRLQIKWMNENTCSRSNLIAAECEGFDAGYDWREYNRARKACLDELAAAIKGEK